jgi:hypothetical protein
MAEVQKSTNAGENVVRFIEFVRMQAQNAYLCLGLIPNPNTGKAEVNLEVARWLIDQLAMIQEKTRGNLNTDETSVLTSALTNLQMAFFEVAQGGHGHAEEEAPVSAAAPEPEPAPAASAAAEPPKAAPAPEAPSVTAGEDRGETKKRFTKSYGG